MFFDHKSIKKDILELYKTLHKREDLSKKWWSWPDNEKRINELEEEDENLLNDILDLYSHAKILRNDPLLREIEETAQRLDKHLKSIQRKKPVNLDPYQLQILENMIYQLKALLAQVEKDEEKHEQRLQNFVYDNCKKRNNKRYFTFYRAEHLAEAPRMNEDFTGQFGKGVYFTAVKDVAKLFRSRPGRIFIFYIDPENFLEMLRPIFISNEDIERFLDLDPAAFKDYIRSIGYGDNRYCIIGPMPDMDYNIQILIDKRMIDYLIEEKILQWRKGEEFNV